ncbi:MAG TPA: hypothetical protein VL463_34405 [Kofleriaceae bacterium]|nr:hypothetical protein [Kofleriaceae bacterium]
MRSRRTIALAALAFAFGLAWAWQRGAPLIVHRVASVGADPLAARGGVVMDLSFDAKGELRERALAILAHRFGKLADESHIDVDGRGARVALIGADPDRALALRRAATLGGVLEMRIVVERGPLIDAIARLDLPPAVERAVDTWPVEDSDGRHRMPYLSSRDRAALDRVIASLPVDRDSAIAVELVTPDVHAKDPRPYWRTYVVQRSAWQVNGSIVDAVTQWDPNTNKPYVAVTFDDAGAQRFGQITSMNVGYKLTIEIDGEVMSAPIINGPIRGGSVQITMSGNDAAQQEDEADALTSALAASAAIPFRIDAEITRTAHADPVRAWLARVLTGLGAALLVLAIAWPLSRWPSLRAAPISSGRAGAWNLGALAPRVLVTIAVPGVMYALRDVAVPGVNGEVLAELRPFGAAPQLVSLLGIGVAPIVLAYVIGAMVGRFAPRQRLPLTIMLAAALALIAGWIRAQYVGAIADPDPLVAAGDRWQVAIELAGGVALYAIGAALIDRWGLGRGFAIMIAVDLLAHASRTPPSVWLTALPVAVIVLVAARTRIERVRLPSGGFIAGAAVPLVLALCWWPVQTAWPRFAFQTFATLQRPSIAIAIAVGLLAPLAWLGTRALRGRDRIVAIALDLAIVLAVVGWPALLHTSWLPAIEMTIVAAVALDVLAEARARSRGAWTVIAETDDPAVADQLLDDQGAPRVARGLHTRAILRGAFPMIAIDVLESRDPGHEDGRLPPARLLE